MLTLTQTIIACVITAIVIFVLTRLINRYDGTLFIDTTDTEKDHYQFVVNDLDEIQRKYCIKIKIIKK